MGQFNPNTPYVLGQEFAPVVGDKVLLDTATEIGHTFEARATNAGLEYAQVMSTVPPPGQLSRKCVSVNIYADGYAAGTGPMRKMIVLPNSGTLGLGASLGGGAGSTSAGVINPSDNGYVALAGASSFMRLWFAVLTARVEQALRYRRIVDITVRYSIAGPFDLLPAGAVTLSLERPSTGAIFNMDDSLTGATTHALNTVPRTTRLGDLNPFWSSAVDPSATTKRHPWHYAAGTNNHIGLTALAAAGGSNINLRLTTSAAAAGMTFQVHYVALEITYCQETRSAAGGVELSIGAVEYFSTYTYVTPIGSMTSYGEDGYIAGGFEYAITAGQGYCGALSVASAVPVTVDRIGTGTDPFPAHRGVVIRKTLRLGEPNVLETTDLIPGVVLYNAAGLTDVSVDRSSQTYLAQALATVDESTASGDVTAQLRDDVAATFPWVRFYARRADATRGGLSVWQTNSGGTQLGPTAHITVDEFDALPEIANGWKQVTLAWSTPVVTAGAAGVLYIAFTTSSEAGGPWQVLGADVNPEDAATLMAPAVSSYESYTLYAEYDATPDLSADLSVMLLQAMPDVDGLEVAPAVQALQVVDDNCGQPAACTPTGIAYHALAWTALNSDIVAGFGYYELQRRDTTMPADSWETIAEITNPAVATMDDYEARVGVESTYRIRFVHELDLPGDWSTSVTATVPAPGVTGATGPGLLILTSNHNPDGNLAYAQWYDGGQPVQDFTFGEGSQTVLQAMYDRDYRVAFRPLERAGVEFNRTLLVNAAGVPPATLDKGFTALRDLAWDTVPYICVRDELHNRWLTSVSVPSGSVRDVRRHGHLNLAQVGFAEVTVTPAPVDYTPECEGLSVQGLASDNIFETPVPATFYNNVVAADAFNRVVVDGWGNADTGGAWTLVGGAAADFDVTGTAATIVSGTVNVARAGTLAGPWADVWVSATVQVSAVALGAAIRAGFMLRYVDANNHFRVEVAFNVGGTMTINFVSRVAGVDTTQDADTIPGAYTGATVVNLQARIRGTFVDGRAWRVGDAEPAWGSGTGTVGLVGLVSNQFLAAGPVGLRVIRVTANTNVNPIVTFDAFTVRKLVTELDIRAHVRPNADQFMLTLDVYNPGGGFAGWALDFTEVDVAFQIYDGGLLEFSVPSADLGLVRNRLRWVRVLYTADNGAGTSTAKFYAGDDGTAWTLIDTIADTPAEQIDPSAGPPDAVIETWVRSGGGITVLSWELLANGVSVLDPDFGAQAPGTTQFTDSTGAVWTSAANGAICAVV